MRTGPQGYAHALAIVPKSPLLSLTAVGLMRGKDQMPKQGRLSNAVIMPGSTPTQAMRWAGKRHAKHPTSVAGTHVLMASTKAPSWSTVPAYQHGAEITGPDVESLERLHAHMGCAQRGQSHHTGSVRHSALTLHHKSTGP